jgi:hypothetical protein
MELAGERRFGTSGHGGAGLTTADDQDSTRTRQRGAKLRRRRAEGVAHECKRIDAGDRCPPDRFGLFAQDRSRIRHDDISLGDYGEMKAY